MIVSKDGQKELGELQHIREQRSNIVEKRVSTPKETLIADLGQLVDCYDTCVNIYLRHMHRLPDATRRALGLCLTKLAVFAVTFHQFAREKSPDRLLAGCPGHAEKDKAMSKIQEILE